METGAPLSWNCRAARGDMVFACCRARTKKMQYSNRSKLIVQALDLLDEQDKPQVMLIQLFSPSTFPPSLLFPWQHGPSLPRHHPTPQSSSFGDPHISASSNSQSSIDRLEPQGIIHESAILECSLSLAFSMHRALCVTPPLAVIESPYAREWIAHMGLTPV